MGLSPSFLYSESENHANPSKTWIDHPKNKYNPLDINFLFEKKLLYLLTLFLVLSFVHDCENCSNSENRASSYTETNPAL